MKIILSYAIEWSSSLFCAPVILSFTHSSSFLCSLVCANLPFAMYFKMIMNNNFCGAVIKIFYYGMESLENKLGASFFSWPILFINSQLWLSRIYSRS